MDPGVVKLEEVESSVPLYLLETFFLLSLSAMGCYLQPNERRDEPGGCVTNLENFFFRGSGRKASRDAIQKGIWGARDPRLSQRRHLVLLLQVLATNLSAPCVASRRRR